MSFVNGFEDILRRDEDLAPHTWFRIGGRAEYFAEPRNLDELAALVRRARDEKLPVRMLGGGSNILIRSDVVPGVVIHLIQPTFAEIAVKDNRVVAGAGARLGHVISMSVREGLAGLETLVGIPGTVGGALRGNAGGRSGDIGQWTSRATLMTRDGELIERAGDELVFAYRQSNLDELVILSGEFKLDSDDPTALTKRMQKHWIVKKANQPLSHQSAGCIFKNPRGMSAGMLIDQAGLKGTRVGGAEVSDRHANFITADQGTTSQDVMKLIDLVKERVAERMGVELETEIEFW
jgi:UDP-N-acetylmuramate dehydrogenase